MNPARASAGHSEISPTLDPADAWAVYEPTSEEPWDLGRVAHLHRRAGFEADWVTLQRDLADGPEAAVDRLLEGEPDALDGQPAADFERFADAMAARVATGGEVGPLRAAWCYRLLLTPHPLRERLTLFWHDHFATSAAKVGKPSLMANQNALLRRYALGSFPDLLRAVARDPAMLTFLDSASNRKAHPNENYAREVMELFTLGRGAYDERDVQEAARAFTGSFLRGDHYRFEPAQHDEGIKDVLGVSGNLDGDSVAAILLDRPACSTFLARKLFALLVDELDPPQDDLIGPVAAAYRDSGYVTRVPVELILRSRLFYSASCRRRRVKSPIEFAVGSVRAFEVTEPTVSATELASACDRMGQTLLAPPSVAGWDGGAAWINTTASLARTNYALAIVDPDDDDLGGRLDPDALAGRHGADSDEAIVDFYADLLVQEALDPSARRRLLASAKSGEGDPASIAREVAGLILSSPEHQLA